MNFSIYKRQPHNLPDAFRRRFLLKNSAPSCGLHTAAKRGRSVGIADRDAIEAAAREILMRDPRSKGPAIKLAPHIGSNGFVAILGGVNEEQKHFTQSAGRVIRHYAKNSSRSLLVSSRENAAPGEIFIPREIMITSPSPEEKLWLSPAEVCYAVLSNHIHNASALETVIPESDIDTLIELASLTIQALVDEIKGGKAYRRSGGGINDGMSYSRRNARLANALCRNLLSIRCHGTIDALKKKTRRGKMLTKLFNQSLNAWAVLVPNSSAGYAESRDAALNAERMLLKMARRGDNDEWLSSEESHFDESPGLPPSQPLGSLLNVDSVSFNTVISAWSRSGRVSNKGESVTDGARRAQAILDLMLEMNDSANYSNESTPIIIPTLRSYEAVIAAWARSTHPEAASKVFVLLDQFKSKAIYPDVRVFTAAMDAFANTNMESAGRTADAVFSESPFKNVLLCNALIGVHARPNQRSWKERYFSGIRIDDVVRDMRMGSGAFRGRQVMPDKISLGMAIRTWSSLARDAPKHVSLHTKQECASRAFSHLEGLLELPAASSPAVVHSFNDVIGAYVWSKMPGSQRIYELLKAHGTKPNVQTFLLLIKSSHTLEDIERVIHEYEITFSEAERKYDAFDTQIRNAAIDKLILDGEVNSADRLLQTRIEKYDLALNDAMENSLCVIRSPRPNTHSFASVLSAYSKLSRRQTADINKDISRAEYLLQKMESYHDFKQSLPSSCQFPPREVAFVTPNTVCYNLILSMYASRIKTDPSNALESVTKCEAIFNRMRLAFASGKNKSCGPDHFTLSSIMAVLANSKQNGIGSLAIRMLEQTRALKGVNKSSGLKIDTVLYNSVLRVVAMDGDTDAERAHAFMKTIPHRDRISFTSVISAYQHEGSCEGAEKAVALYREMQRSEDPGMQPDGITLECTIRAILSGSDADAAPAKIASLVGEATSRSIVSSRHYNLTLLACSDAAPCEHVLRVASEAFERAKAEPDLTDHTFGLFILFLRKHVPDNDPRRSKLILAVFQHAAKDGLVSPFVFHSLKKSVPFATIRKVLLMDDANNSYKGAIPQDWRRNCKPRSSPNRHASSTPTMIATIP